MASWEHVYIRPFFIHGQLFFFFFLHNHLYFHKMYSQFVKQKTKINKKCVWHRYKWLDRTFPGTTKQIVVKKLLLDQFFMTPQLLVVFYTGKWSFVHTWTGIKKNLLKIFNLMNKVFFIQYGKWKMSRMQWKKCKIPFVFRVFRVQEWRWWKVLMMHLLN